MAVQLGYTNVLRDPHGYPAWAAAGLPTASAPAGLSGGPEPVEAPGLLYGWAMVWTLAGIFLGGMALNLTPCVYPLIPITVSYFGGRSGQGRGKLAFHGVLYMLGLALMNSVLGVTAALTGGLMGALLQHPAVLIVVAAALLAFASSLFGFWELRLPASITRAAAKSYSGYFGTLFMGLTLGVVAAPCLGPFVLGLLTWVASMGSPWLGFIVFFTLSLGLGLPLFVLALFSGRLNKLPRSGEWMLWVRKLMGWVLVGMAAYFIRPLLPHGAGVALLVLVALSAGLHLGFVDRSRSDFKAFRWLKLTAGLVGIVLATWMLGAWLMLGPSVDWRPYSPAVLAEARAAGKPAIIDFYADWCAPCRELEEITFHDPKVVQLAGEGFVMVKVDLTGKGNPSHERLLEEYEVKGVPTVVFLDKDGRERKDLRIVDFLPPEPFLGLMRQLAPGENKN